MNDNFYIKDVKVTSSEGVRLPEAPKKPLGSASPSKSFKQILEKDEDSSDSNKVTDKEDLTEEESPLTNVAPKTKPLIGTRGKKGPSSGESVFSLLGSQKGKAKQPTLQPSGEDLSENSAVGEQEGVVGENEGEINPQLIAKADSQVKSPKEFRQQQSALETTFIQSAPVESKEKPEPQANLRGLPKSVQKEKSTVGQGSQESVSGMTSRATARGEEQEDMAWEESKTESPPTGQTLAENKVTPESKLAHRTIPSNKPPTMEDARAFGMMVSEANRTKEEPVPEESPASAIAKEKTPEDVPGLTKLADSSPEVSTDESRLVKKTKEESSVVLPHEEQVDLSSINPQGLITPVAAIDASATPTVTTVARPTPLSPTMSALLEQLVKEITTMENSNKTETTIVLQNNPLFVNARGEPAQVTITGYQGARGFIDVTFSNLTPAAQNVIAQEQRSLMVALETRGYFVNAFTATTVDLQSPIAASQPSERESQQQQRQRQGGFSQGDEEREA